MSVSLTVARSSGGSQIKDKLANDQIGINHGEVTNNVETLEEIFYLTHDGLNAITDLKLYIEGLSEIIQWADDNANDGILLDSNNDGVYNFNIKTGLGDTLANAINLGNINSGEEKIIKVKIKVPSGEYTVGIRNFYLKFNYDFTS
jgi:hypothetical protein